MFHRRHMPVYLVVAWTLLDVLILVGGMVHVGSHRTVESVLVPLIWGQFLAITGWLALGNRGRVAAFFSAIAWFVLLVLAGNRSIGMKEVFFLLQGLMAVAIYGWFLMLPLVLVRCKGFQFDFAPKRAGDRPPFYQVSLRQMMAYTLLVALVSAAWSAALAGPSRRDMSAMSGFVLGLTMAFLLPWLIWLCFCWLQPLHGGVVALLVTGLWGAMFARLINRSPDSLLFTLVPSSVLIVHLLALQLADFRFRRVRMGDWIVTDD